MGHTVGWLICWQFFCLLHRLWWIWFDRFRIDNCRWFFAHNRYSAVFYKICSWFGCCLRFLIRLRWHWWKSQARWFRGHSIDFGRMCFFVVVVFVNNLRLRLKAHRKKLNSALSLKFYFVFVGLASNRDCFCCLLPNRVENKQNWFPKSSVECHNAMWPIEIDKKTNQQIKAEMKKKKLRKI